MQRLRLLLVGLLLSIVASWFYTQQQRERQRVIESPVPAPSYPLKRDPVPASRTVQASPATPDILNTEPAVAGIRQDHLIDIDGIGPVFAKALNLIGIYTFTELAAQDADTLADKLPAAITADRIRRDRWIEQAKQLQQK